MAVQVTGQHGAGQASAPLQDTPCPMNRDHLAGTEPVPQLPPLQQLGFGWGCGSMQHVLEAEKGDEICQYIFFFPSF